MTGPEIVEERAALWLVRREEPDWTPDEEEAFQGWIGESDAHKVAYWRLKHGWRQADRIGALGAAAYPANDWRGALRSQWWKPFAAAASLLLVFGTLVLQMGGLSSGRDPSVQVASFQTEVGGKKLIDLPDGSRIEMNTETVLRAEVGPSQRTVWLDRGEAYFDVVHAEGSPFVVHVGPRTITVLGTRFAVRRAGEKVIVSVAEGRVRVEDATTGAPVRSATITGGDVAVAEGQSTLVTTNSQERVEDHLAWRQNMLLFDETILADAAAEFNRYNSRQIVIADPAAAQIRIGGTFHSRNVDAFVRLLQQAYGLDIETTREKVTISG